MRDTGPTSLHNGMLIDVCALRDSAASVVSRQVVEIRAHIVLEFDHGVDAAAAMDGQSPVHRGLETGERFPQAPTPIFVVTQSPLKSPAPSPTAMAW